MAKVILDAGHGGNDLGAVFNNRYEKNDTMKLTLAVGRVLEENGIQVVYTRIDDQYQSQLERINRANREEGDLFVSIHRAQGPSQETFSFVRGLLYKEGGIQQAAVENILRNLEEQVGFHNIGVRIREEILVLKNINMPSIMLDVGVINSRNDNQLFDTRLEDIANAIAMGIIETLRNENEYEASTVSSTCQRQTTENRYRVQVGLFQVYNNALNLQSQLLQQGFQAEIVCRGDFFAVYVGDFNNLDDAVEVEQMLRRNRYNTLIVTL